MSATFDGYRPRRSGITIPTIAVWIAFSLLVHLSLLLWQPSLRKTHDEFALPPLTAYLRPAPQRVSPPQAEAPPPSPAARPIERVPLRPDKPPAPPPPKPRPAQQAPPPVVALAKPPVADQPAMAPVPVPVPVAPKAEPPPVAQLPRLATPPPAETDLSAYIASRQRARGEEAEPSAAESAARGALNSAAMKQAPAPVLAEKKRPNGYGSFRIKRRGYDYAEFDFYGWNESFGRDWAQSIDVRKGNHSDIDIAVIRSIIAVIRRSESGDFTWYSYRLGRSLTLSARARDNSSLEDFIMKEFYDDLHRYR